MNKAEGVGAEGLGGKGFLNDSLRQVGSIYSSDA